MYVNVRTMDRFGTACYMARHYAITLRPFAWENITRDAISRWETIRRAESKHVEPTEAPKLSKSDDTHVHMFLDRFPELLLQYNGVDGRPLSYVLRENSEVPASDVDPPVVSENSNYTSVCDEIAARASVAPHDQGWPNFLLARPRYLSDLN